MKKWSIGSSQNEWNVVLNNISADLEEAGYESEFINSFELAIDEVFANIDMHAYGEDGGVVEIELDADSHMVQICFRDNGAQFNPLVHKSQKVNADSVQDIKVGGHGISIIKQQSDEITYSYENGTNVLKIKKYRQEN